MMAKARIACGNITMYSSAEKLIVAAQPNAIYPVPFKAK